MHFTRDENNVLFVEFYNVQNFLIRCECKDIDETLYKLDFYIKYRNVEDWKPLYLKFISLKHHIKYTLADFKTIVFKMPDDNVCCVELSSVNSSTYKLICKIQLMSYEQMTNMLNINPIYFKTIDNGIQIFSFAQNKIKIYDICKKLYPQMKIRCLDL
jgi:hypothetical protein